MARKSAHGLPPGIQLDKDGVFWATLAGDDAERYRQQHPGQRAPRRKAVDLKDAMRQQRQLIRDLEGGRDSKAKNPKVAAWVREYLDGRETIKATTRKRHEGALARQIAPHRIGKMNLLQVDHAAVTAWVQALKKQAPSNRPGAVLDPYTIRNAFALLRAALNAAVVQNLIPKNPCQGVEIPRPDDDEVEPLNPDQVAQLLDLVDTFEASKATGAARPHRLAALYHVAIRCGLRQSELCGLRWRDVDFEKRELRVRDQMLRGKRDSTKTKRSRRSVPFSRDVERALRWHQQNQREEAAISAEGWNAGGLVFCSEEGTGLWDNNLRRQLDSLLRRAGIPRTKFHNLRHTYAALSIAAGMDLMTLSRRMGHSTIRVTADTYGHLYEEHQHDPETVDRLIKRAS
jgi:integrase